MLSLNICLGSGDQMMKLKKKCLFGVTFIEFDNKGERQTICLQNLSH